MKKTLLAVCDADREYGKKLCDYVRRHEGAIYDSRYYESYEMYETDVSEKVGSVLLLDESVAQTGKTGGETRLILSTGEKETEGENILFKYQSADNLLKQIHKAAGQEPKRKCPCKPMEQDQQIISICSFHGHEVAIPFLMVVAEEYAKRKKVLCIGMSVFSDMKKCMGVEAERDLGHLLYLLQEGEDKLMAEYHTCVQRVGGFDVILPPENPELLLQYEEEIKKLIDILFQKLSYQTILVHINNMFAGMKDVLERSHRIWMIKEKRNTQDTGMEDFRQYLRRHHTGMEKRIEEIFVPKNLPLREDGPYRIEELYMGELGRCVRRLVEAEDESGNRENTKVYTG